MSRHLPQRVNPLILSAHSPQYEDLVARRRLGRTNLAVNPSLLNTSNATKPENLGVFEYAHLRAPLPKDLTRSELFAFQSKKPTPESYFLMRRSKDGYVSATGMFKVAFPWATHAEEINERKYLKSQPHTSEDEIAGNVWVSPAFAGALAEEYQMSSWIGALLDPTPISHKPATSDDHISSPPAFQSVESASAQTPPSSQKQQNRQVSSSRARTRRSATPGNAESTRNTATRRTTRRTRASSKDIPDSDAGDSTADEMNKSTKRGGKRAVSRNMEKVPEVPEVPEPTTVETNTSTIVTTETVAEGAKKDRTPKKNQVQQEEQQEEAVEPKQEKQDAQIETKQDIKDEGKEEEQANEKGEDKEEEKSSLKRSFFSFFTRPKSAQAKDITDEAEEEPSQNADEKTPKKSMLPFFGEDMPFPLSQLAGPSPQDTAQMIEDASKMVADAKEAPKTASATKSSAKSIPTPNKRKAAVQQTEDERLDALAARDDVTIPYPGESTATERPAKRSRMLSERLKRERVKNRSFYGFTAALGLVAAIPYLV